VGAQGAGTEGGRRLQGIHATCRLRVTAPRVITTTYGWERGERGGERRQKKTEGGGERQKRGGGEGGGGEVVGLGGSGNLNQLPGPAHPKVGPAKE
jgi:hypothetical protein